MTTNLYYSTRWCALTLYDEPVAQGASLGRMESDEGMNAIEDDLRRRGLLEPVDSFRVLTAPRCFPRPRNGSRKKAWHSRGFRTV